MAKPTFQQFASAIMGAVPTDLSSNLYQLWIDNPDILAGALRQTLRTFPQSVAPPFPSYLVTVNYNLTVGELIKKVRYHWFNDSITDQRFSIKKQGKDLTEIFIVSIDHRMSESEVNQLLDDFSLRDANIKELLSLSAQHPELQCKGPIVARAMTWPSPDRMLMGPYLLSNGSALMLHLIPIGGHWDTEWRFAAVRKSE